jgi:plasmid stabilization system protein ParE
MRVRWTTDAADDLERICDYIAQNRPESAQRDGRNRRWSVFYRSFF